MNSRERMELTLNHREADRVPRYNWFCPAIRNELKKILNVSDDYELSNEFGHDFVLVFAGYPSPWLVQDSTKLKKEGKIFKDEWDIEYKTTYSRGGYYPTIVKNPIKNLEDYKNYKFPDPLSDKNYKLLENIIKKYKKEKYIFAGNVSTIFEGSWFLRGMENLLVDLYQNPGYVEELFDRFVKFKVKVGKKAAKLGADVIWLGDDLGMQDRMMIPPEIFRKYLKLRYAKIINGIKSENKDVKVAFHTCGYIEPIIPDFIEIGIDILNSLQPVNDLGMIKKRYGKNIIFWGGIDIQEVLPIGNPGDVISELKEKVEILSPGGGYIICGSNEIEYSDKVIDNIFTYYWALDRYGKYN